jgi:uncharacterized protein YjbI with pentapeptide repeats
MTGLLEDILSEADSRAIDAVFSSKVLRFDKLVKLSGLNKSADFKYANLANLDFRGADLRGFDFSGSDLRNCAIDSETLIDNTTILDEALIGWIEYDDLSLVRKMLDVERSVSAASRQDLLREIILKHGRSEHVIKYMVAAATSANELDIFLDFFTQFPSDISTSQLSSLQKSAIKLLNRKFNQARKRTGRESTAIFAVDAIMSRLENSPGDLGRLLFGIIAEIVNQKPQTKQLRGMANVDPSDITAAFSRLIHVDTISSASNRASDA